MSDLKIKDVKPELVTNSSSQLKVSQIPIVLNPVIRYGVNNTISRGYFHFPEYDLLEIAKVIDTDGYASEAFAKKASLMFKEGWDLIGKDRKTVKYVKARLAQLSRAAGTPIEEVFRAIGTSLIQKSNGFLYKKRQLTASGGQVRKLAGRSKAVNPVAAYFIIPAESMSCSFTNGVIERWRQSMPTSTYIDFAPEDIIHFHYRRKDGFLFGTPTITPTIDDIRALRKIEENIELLIYQHLFPLFHYKVGTESEPAGITEDGQNEIDVIRREIQFMPSEGGIVTPHRHSITAIGSEGRALRAESYLEHFKKRVFSGLGISAMDMGEGEGSNRSTAVAMSRNLIDSVKDIQQQLEIFINEHIVNELLLESTFGPDVLEPEMIVKFKFKEIDVDAQIKRETHAADQFNKNMMTWDESRARAGLEPILTPTSEEVQGQTDSQKKFPEWNNTNWKLFKYPQMFIVAGDEPYSEAAQAVAQSKTTQSRQNINNTPVQAKQPQNLKKTTESVLSEHFNLAKKEIKAFAKIIDFDNSIVISDNLIRGLQPLKVKQLLQFKKGFASVSDSTTSFFYKEINNVRELIDAENKEFALGIEKNINRQIKKHINGLSTKEQVLKIESIFDINEFKIEVDEQALLTKYFELGIKAGNLAKPLTI